MPKTIRVFHPENPEKVVHLLKIIEFVFAVVSTNVFYLVQNTHGSVAGSNPRGG